MAEGAGEGAGAPERAKIGANAMAAHGRSPIQPTGTVPACGVAANHAHCEPLGMDVRALHSR